MTETTLVDFINRYALDMASDAAVDVVLRAVPDPWPFPAHLRVVPEIVAAIDLAESIAPALAELGRARLKELGEGSSHPGSAGRNGASRFAHSCPHAHI